METENYQVSKSKGLLALSELNLSLNELKILDIYLSRIDPRSIKDLENETVEKLHNKNLTKKEVKEILDYRNDFIKKSATVSFPFSVTLTCPLPITDTLSVLDNGSEIGCSFA